LGNIGKSYENTRHNIGFKVIDALALDFGARDISKNAFYGQVQRSSNTIFLKPSTFMNLSGKAVQAVKNFFKIDIENIIVIHDDIDLAFGGLRFKRAGGAGGHNGLKSIDEMIGKEYIRVRIGVAKPKHRSQVADYVLHNFSDEENKHLDRLISHIVLACKDLQKETLTKVKSNYSLKNIEALYR